MKKSHVVMRARASHFLNEPHALNVQGWYVKDPYVGLGTAEGAKVEVFGYQHPRETE
jgi:hypothetical protein